MMVVPTFDFVLSQQNPRSWAGAVLWGVTLPWKMGSFPPKRHQPPGVNERLAYTGMVGCADGTFDSVV
jgi:hypothetical protein